MKVFKIFAFPVVLLLLMNGCGLSLEVQKRVHRPGFYVNLSHEKEYVKVKGEKESRRTETQEETPASLQKVKRNSYEEFEIETDEPSVAKAPLMDVTDSNFSVAEINKGEGSTGFTKRKERRFFMLRESLENLRSIPGEAQASHVAGRGVTSMLFSFNLMDLIEIALLLFLIYLLSYLFMILFILATFSTLNPGFLVVYVLVILAVALLYVFVSGS